MRAARALAALKTGRHYGLMRHAKAPGRDDPADFRHGDCATQRNLSQRGRSDAVAVGQRLRREGVRFDRIASSPWCRCLDTARLVDLGPVEISEAFSNVVVLSDRREAIIRAGREAIVSWSGALLIVTHGANIAGLVGINPGSGEIVVVTRRQDKLEVVGRLPVPGN